MVETLIPESVWAAVAGGLLFSTIFYTRNRRRYGTPFKPAKFIGTLAAGLFIGLLAAQTGVELTMESFTAQMVLYAGPVALVYGASQWLFTEIERSTPYSISAWMRQVLPSWITSDESLNDEMSESDLQTDLDSWIWGNSPTETTPENDDSDSDSDSNLSPFRDK